MNDQSLHIKRLSVVSMVNTCVGSEFHGHVPVIPTNVIVFIAGASVNLFVRCVVFYVENLDSPPLPGKEKNTSFGFGAKGAAKATSSLGLAFSIPELVLWFVFYGIGDKNGLEFACQIESGYAYIPTIIIGYFAYMMWATNFMRIYTRHSFARVILPYINADEDSSVSRVALLPAYRGIWLSPIIQQYNKKCKEQGVAEGRTINNEYYALDCYESVYNPENTAWFKANMILEHCLPSSTAVQSLTDTALIPHKLSIVWTNFLTFNLADNSLDTLIIPIGGVIAFLNASYAKEETKEDKHTRAVTFFKECKRVLRPKGTLIASNLFFTKAEWLRGLQDAGFVDLKEADELVWWSYLPAKVTIAYKSSEKEDESIGNESTSPMSHLHHSTTPSLQNNLEDGTRTSLVTSQVSRFEVSSIDEKTGDNKTRGGSMFQNANFKIVVFLILLIVLFYLGFVVFSYSLLTPMQVPTMLPYGQMISALFISNCYYIPIALFGMIGELLLIVSMPLSSFKEMTEVYLFEQRKLIYKIFWKHSMNIVVVMTVVSFLGWLPFFALDYLLIEGANQSTKTVQNVNIGVGIVVGFVLIPTAKYLYEWYTDREKKQQEEIKAIESLGEESSQNQK